MAFTVYFGLSPDVDFIDAFAAVSYSERRLVFEQYFDKLGVQKMLDELDAFYPVCHSQAHDLGKVILATEKDINKSIEMCGNSCTGGCFHGVLMEAFAGIDFKTDDSEGHIDLDSLKHKMRTICSDDHVSDIQRIGNCAHGMGHALAYISNYNLKEALASCELFDAGPLIFYCTSGVFMEYDIVHGSDETPSLYYPCDKFTDYPAACWRYRSRHVVYGLGSNQEYAYDCMARSGFDRLGCFHGFGFYHIEKIVATPSNLRHVCQFGNMNDKKICIEGAIEKLADIDAVAAKNACNSMYNIELKNHCIVAANNKLYTLDKSFDLYYKN
jgi:hypothetical protein